MVRDLGGSRVCIREVSIYARPEGLTPLIEWELENNMKQFSIFVETLLQDLRVQVVRAC